MRSAPCHVALGLPPSLQALAGALLGAGLALGLPAWADRPVSVAVSVPVPVPVPVLLSGPAAPARAAWPSVAPVLPIAAARGIPALPVAPRGLRQAR